MYDIKFSINIEVCGHFFYEFCYFQSLELALTVVKDVFCGINCVKCKKYMVLCFISLKSSKLI